MPHSSRHFNSNSSHSNFEAPNIEAPDVQPTLSDKPTPPLKPNPISKLDTTTYSFAWSNSLEHTESSKHQQDLSREYQFLNTPIKSWAMSNSGVSGSVFSKPPTKAEIDIRTLPPSLPRPVHWSALTQPELFKEYIASESLISHCLDEPSVTEDEVPQPLPEPFKQAYSNIQSIIIANTDMEKVILNCTTSWIDDHLFANKKLPAPFVPSFLLSDATLWRAKSLDESGDHTFANLPNLADEKETTNWLNHLGNCLGILHGLVPASPSSDPNQTIVEDCADRSFDCEGSNKPLARGLFKRKPDIVVIDRNFRHHIPTSVCLSWPVVQALIEITSQNDRPMKDTITTMLAKASNIFYSQLHRRYVIGLSLFGKKEKMQFSIIFIDRTGAICTKPVHIRGYGAMTLARIIYGLTFGNAELLGADPKISIDRFTGDPQSVVVDGQRFTVITEIHTSPLLFSRGTRVYIVQDQYGRYHILKDSWILASHKDSEIDHIKNISSKVQTEGLDERSQVLSPRFVAGENHVDDTDEPRGLLSSKEIARIRCRIVTGLIGDPITTYCSRVECLQALIDVVDQLKFLHDKCGLVHGDISISNVIIVRFLPDIIAALQPHLSTSLASAFTAIVQAPSPTAGKQLAECPSSLLLNSSTTATIPWKTLPACTTPGLSYPLNSGGSIIDFDYSRAKDTLSAKTSGTMPYMSIELMTPKKPLVHKLAHDLESVFMVLLHIVSFTCGPSDLSGSKIKLSHHIAQWHHEANPKFLVDQKTIDIARVNAFPENRLTDYWLPIAPFIQELINVVYPNYYQQYNVESQATVERFKNVLTRALEHCQTLPEIPSNYAIIRPSSRKRPRTKSTAKDCPALKHLCTSKEGMPYELLHHPHVVPFSQYQDSATLKSENQG